MDVAFCTWWIRCITNYFGWSKQPRLARLLIKDDDPLTLFIYYPVSVATRTRSSYAAAKPTLSDGEYRSSTINPFRKYMNPIPLTIGFYFMCKSSPSYRFEFPVYSPLSYSSIYIFIRFRSSLLHVHSFSNHRLRIHGRYTVPVPIHRIYCRLSLILRRPRLLPVS